MLAGMEIRPAATGPAGDAEPARRGSDCGDGPWRWRVPPWLIWLRAAGAVLIAGAAALFGRYDRPALVLLGVVAIALAAFAVRDLRAPVRLAADSGGLTVVDGFAGTRRLAWPDIAAIRVDERSRLGRRVQLLEIDADDRLYLFSSYELSAPCADVARRLEAIRARCAR
jgi:hypothetical protein